jgi:hypothetical protein
VCSCEAGHTHLPRHALGSLRRVNFFFGLGFFWLGFLPVGRGLRGSVVPPPVCNTCRTTNPGTGQESDGRRAARIHDTPHSTTLWDGHAISASEAALWRHSSSRQEQGMCAHRGRGAGAAVRLAVAVNVAAAVRVERWADDGAPPAAGQRGEAGRAAGAPWSAAPLRRLLLRLWLRLLWLWLLLLLRLGLWHTHVLAVQTPGGTHAQC